MEDLVLQLAAAAAVFLAAVVVAVVVCDRLKSTLDLEHCDLASDSLLDCHLLLAVAAAGLYLCYEHPSDCCSHCSWMIDPPFFFRVADGCFVAAASSEFVVAVAAGHVVPSIPIN